MLQTGPILDPRREPVSCPICDVDACRTLYNVRGRALPELIVDGIRHRVIGTERIVQCKHCGLVYVNPRIEAMAGTRSYTLDQELGYFALTQHQRRVAYTDILKRLRLALGGTGQLLDIGFGDGLLLAIARDQGWQVSGLEVSPPMLEYARSTYGLDHLTLASVDNAEFEAGRFDVVVLMNVIEHLRDPVGALRRIFRALRPVGLLAVHTVNIHSLDARLSGRRWRHLEPYEHFFYFSASTLSLLLAKAGLEVVEPFGLLSRSKLKRWAMLLSLRWGLHWDNGLGLLARKPAIR